MSQSIENPFPIFIDTNGETLENGYIYIGEAGLNPEVSPIDVFWDKDFLYPAAQPIRTLNGLPSRSGTPSAIFTKFDDYSIKVDNSNNELIYSAIVSGVFTNEYLNPVDTIAALRLVDVEFVLDNQLIDIKGSDAIGDGYGGQYYWNASSTDTDNNGTIIQSTGVATGRWIRLYANYPADKTVTVGSGGDFTTINDALEFLSGSAPAYIKSGLTVEISLLAGFVAGVFVQECV